MQVMKFIEGLNRALYSKTLYVQGAFGANGTQPNKRRYTNNLAYNAKRADMINAADKNTYFFDCICLGKAVLWHWDGNINNQPYCGAKYGSNGVPDFGTEQMKNYMYDISKEFTPDKMVVGEWLYLKGHAGYYIGVADDGLPYAIECTPKWQNGVQITAIDMGNGVKSDRFPTRKWTYHGKMKFIEY